MYLAPRYVATDEGTFGQYRAITLRYGGSADAMREPADWTDGLSFVAGTAGVSPSIGDTLLINQTDRLDGFTADGRFFVLYES